MRSGTDCGNKKRRIDCRLVLEMAQEEPFQTGGWGVAQRSPLGLSVHVSVQWFGSSAGALGCCWVWFPHRGISIRKFPILFLPSAERDFHSAPDAASPALPIFPVEPGINAVSTPLPDKSANCICLSLEGRGSRAAFSFGRSRSDGATAMGCDQRAARSRKIHSLSDPSDSSIL